MHPPLSLLLIIVIIKIPNNNKITVNYGQPPLVQSYAPPIQVQAMTYPAQEVNNPTATTTPEPITAEVIYIY